MTANVERHGRLGSKKTTTGCKTCKQVRPSHQLLTASNVLPTENAKSSAMKVNRGAVDVYERGVTA